MSVTVVTSDATIQVNTSQRVLSEGLQATWDASTDPEKNTFVDANKTEIVSFFDWWLAEGLIPESDTYTIYDPIAASDLASSYENKVNPGVRDASLGVTPTHTVDRGWIYNGVDDFLKTSTICVEDQTVVIWFENWRIASSFVIGSSNEPFADEIVRFVPDDGGQFSLYRNTKKFEELKLAGGILHTSDKGGALGSDLTDAFVWAPGTIGIEYYIGCNNSNGSPAGFGSGNICRVAIYDFLLTTTQLQELAKTMFSYNQAADDSYKTIVLSLNPIAYYSCNQTFGSCLFDLSGNDAHQCIGDFNDDFKAGRTGEHGNAIGGDTNGLGRFRSFSDWNTKTGFNLDLFSFSCWFNIQSDAGNQVRILQARGANATEEYYTVEVRIGDALSIFHKEAGVVENTPTLHTISDNTWHHMVCYNDKANLKSGIYLDGVKVEFSKTAPGFTITTTKDSFPTGWFDVNGDIQHMAYWDHVLSQSEVDILNV